MTRTNLVDRLRARNGLPAPTDRARIRVAAGVSQREVARELGVAKMSVRRWELGECNPGPENITAYARLLDDLQMVAAPVRSASP